MSCLFFCRSLWRHEGNPCSCATLWQAISHRSFDPITLHMALASAGKVAGCIFGILRSPSLTLGNVGLSAAEINLNEARVCCNEGNRWNAYDTNDHERGSVGKRHTADNRDARGECEDAPWLGSTIGCFVPSPNRFEPFGLVGWEIDHKIRFVKYGQRISGWIVCGLLCNWMCLST